MEVAGRLALALLAFNTFSAALFGQTSAAEIRNGLSQLSIDPAESYRVRELQLNRGGVKIFLSEGVLCFTKRIEGHMVAALFTADAVEAGDAEILTFPPDRAERSSLASFTGSPNLDEHFTTALLFFADRSEEELLTQIRQRPIRPAADLAAKMEQLGNQALRTNASQIDVRLTQALLDQHRPDQGFFYALIGTRNKGAFDFSFQPDQQDSVTFGRMAAAAQGDVNYFQIWATFHPRGLPDQASFVNIISDYRIDVTIHPDLSLHATARLKYQAQETDGRTLPLQLTSRLVVTSAKVDGEPAEFFQHSQPQLEKRRGAAPLLVTAAHLMPPGTTHELELEYEGSAIHKTKQGSYFVDDRHAWYPFVNAGRASFDLIFHCPEKLRLVATGEPVSDEISDGIRTVHRKTASPQALAGFNLGEYSATASTSGPYRIEVEANQSLSSLTDIPAQTGKLLDFYTKLWGILPQKSLVVSPIEGYFGQGFPGLIYLSDVAYTQEQDRPSSLRTARLDSFFTQMLLPHEVAHQWWGNIVTPADYRSTWILEALANYAAFQYLEATQGHTVAGDVLKSYRAELLTPGPTGKTAESYGPVVFGERLLDNYGGGVWHDVIYEKGAWIFHMMRQRLGDKLFAQLLQRLLRDYSDRPITTEELRREAAALAPDGPDRGFSNFFDTWIYGTGIPTLSLNDTGLVLSGVDDDYIVDVPLACQITESSRVSRWVHAVPGTNTGAFRGCHLPATAEFLYR